MQKTVKENSARDSIRDQYMRNDVEHTNGKCLNKIFDLETGKHSTELSSGSASSLFM